MRRTRAFGIAVLALGSALPVGAAPLFDGKVPCAAPHTAAESLFLHQQRILHEHQTLDQKRTLPDQGMQLQPWPPRAQEDVTGGSYDDGDIAVIEASQHLIAPANPVDLSNQKVTIAPGEDGFTVSAGALVFDVASAERGLPVSLDDDDFALVELPFSFPYFGETYDYAFVNSDGNLTFIWPDPRSTARNFSRAVGGVPRIAPLFRDLDPSRGGKVRFESLAGKVIVTWYQVPVFVSEGTGAVQTFQVELAESGSIEFRYGSLTADGAVVGIMPGDPSKVADVVDWSAATAGSYASDRNLAEVFSSESALDEFAVAQAFFSTHEDAFDQLIVVNDMDIEASESSLAHAYAVRNEVRGINQEIGSFGQYLGSSRRLSGFVNMGSFNDYPGSPYAPLRTGSSSSMLSILAHEIGHRFLAYPGFIDPATDSLSTAILGRDLAHWSFFFHSEASVLEGNAIRDNGVGADPRFETFAATQTFSLLDQYLMGLLPASEVPAMWLVENPTGAPGLGTPSRAPQTGVGFNGTRKEVLIDHIIKAEGERRPDSTVSQRHFRHAFALVVEDASADNTQAIAKMNLLRRGWLQFSRLHLESKATMTTDLVKMLHLSTWPAGGVISGATGKARVEISEARDTDLTVSLTLDEAIATVPATVTIPAGSVDVEFEISGLETGVTTLKAHTSESGYDEAVTRLNVRAEVAGLILEEGHAEKLYGAAGTEVARPLRYRVRDENLIPYSGIELAFEVSPAGAPSISSASTDADGEVSTSWQLGALPGEYEVTASLRGDPDQKVVTQAEAVTQTPTLDLTTAVNAASMEPPATGQGFAPGSLVTIGGSGLALQTVSAEVLLAAGNSSLPNRLGGAQVAVGGLAAPLLRLEPTRVTFQLPFDIQGSSTHVVMSTRYGRTGVITLPLSPTQPGLFPDRVRAGSTGAVLGVTPGTSALPQAGGLLEIQGTGLGQVDPSGRTGFAGQLAPVQNVVATTRAWVDGSEVDVESSRLSVLEAGVYVVLVDLPDSLASGEHKVKIEVGGRESNEVTFEVQEPPESDLSWSLGEWWTDPCTASLAGSSPSSCID